MVLRHRDLTTRDALVREKTHYLAIGYHRSLGSLIYRIATLCNVKRIEGFEGKLSTPLRSLFWCAVEELELVVEREPVEEERQPQPAIREEQYPDPELDGGDAGGAAQSLDDAFLLEQNESLSLSDLGESPAGGGSSSPTAGCASLESPGARDAWKLGNSSCGAVASRTREGTLQNSSTNKNLQNSSRNAEQDPVVFTLESPATQQTWKPPPRGAVRGKLRRLPRPRYVVKDHQYDRWEKRSLPSCVWWTGSEHGWLRGGSPSRGPSPRASDMEGHKHVASQASTAAPVSTAGFMSQSSSVGAGGSSLAATSTMQSSATGVSLGDIDFNLPVGGGSRAAPGTDHGGPVEEQGRGVVALQGGRRSEEEQQEQTTGGPGLSPAPAGILGVEVENYNPTEDRDGPPIESIRSAPDLDPFLSPEQRSPAQRSPAQRSPAQRSPAQRSPVAPWPAKLTNLNPN